MTEISTTYSPIDASNVVREVLPVESSSLDTSNFSMKDLIQQLQASDGYRDQIVPDGHRTFPEHLAEYGIHTTF